MPRTRPPYLQKFREKIVELARNGRTPKELAEEILEEDVEALAGERHSRGCPSGKSLHRCGYNPGMRRLTGYKDLPKLKRALKEAIPDRE